MDAYELLGANLGTPPQEYKSQAAYRADIKRLAAVVHRRGGDYYGVDEYAASICRSKAGRESIDRFSLCDEPNNPELYGKSIAVNRAIGRFSEDVSDEVDRLDGR